ncbi:MAG TPA: hypothetical protein VKB57_21625 [Acidimicrobiales bacterium]|nr:hypothetical protein [Acidimicrobiales bacterium]
MIWLTWRQLRTGTVIVGAAVAALAALLALTGPGVAHDYAAAIAACAEPAGACSAVGRFFDRNQMAWLAVTAIVLVVPPLIGAFWGAPLVSRELEAGTHRLAWTQSVTRTRWLAVKLGLTGLTAVAVAGLCSLAVTWWAGPLDHSGDMARIEPLEFASRGVVPVAYAAFALALGATAGLLIRRPLPAMAVTLALFVTAQIAMPILVRPHLLSPTRSTVAMTEASVDTFAFGPDHALRVSASAAPRGAWVLSSHAVDPSGKRVSPITISAASGPCARPGSPGGPADSPPGVTGPDGDPLVTGCLAELQRLGYRIESTYHRASRFWPFQWYEAGIYTLAALGLAGICFWRIRRVPA